MVWRRPAKQGPLRCSVEVTLKSGAVVKFYDTERTPKDMRLHLTDTLRRAGIDFTWQNWQNPDGTWVFVNWNEAAGVKVSPWYK